MSFRFGATTSKLVQSVGWKSADRQLRTVPSFGAVPVTITVFFCPPWSVPRFTLNCPSFLGFFLPSPRPGADSSVCPPFWFFASPCFGCMAETTRKPPWNVSLTTTFWTGLSETFVTSILYCTSCPARTRLGGWRTIFSTSSPVGPCNISPDEFPPEF